ncbi:hypothetical protein Tco_1078660 [Tanacetum coccineum]|uniref:Transposase (Putative), gypsy type n=1 Tax=Tanacetum coccineum TaxID=301880 RepID=A0ABQ5HPP7_9ASTR
MGRDTIQLESAVSTISQEYLLEFTSEYGILEGLHPELPNPEDMIVNFSEGKIGVYTRFFEFANFRIPISQFLFDILGHYQIHLSQLSVIGAAKVSHFEITCGQESVSHRRRLVHKRFEGWNASSRLLFRCGCGSIEHAPYPHPKTTRRIVMPSRVEPKILPGGRCVPTFLYDDDRDMDLFNLISAPNPTKVKTGTRPRAAYEVPLLTVTANRVIDMGDAAATSESSGTPSTIEKSPLDFANEDPPQTITERGGTEDQGQDGLSREIPPVDNPMPAEVAPDLGKEMAAMGPTVNKRRHKGGKEDTGANAPRKVLRTDHDTSRLTQSTLGGKSLAAMGLKTGSTFSAPASSSEVPSGHMATTEVQDLFSIKSPESGKSASYQPGWGVINTCRQDTPDACQDVVYHIASPGYFFELHCLLNADFLSQYNMNLARQSGEVSQLSARRREEKIKKLNQEVKSLQAIEVEVHGLCIRTKNLETLLKAEVDMKKAAEAKNTELIKELKSLRVQFLDL